MCYPANVQLMFVVTHVIRQGRCTLVATIQMYKILALNCLITVYSLSVQYLDAIMFGDYQLTITGMLMSICFMCISHAKVRWPLIHFRVYLLISCITCREAVARMTIGKYLQLLCFIVLYIYLYPIMIILQDVGVTADGVEFERLANAFTMQL